MVRPLFGVVLVIFSLHTFSATPLPLPKNLLELDAQETVSVTEVTGDIFKDKKTAQLIKELSNLDILIKCSTSDGCKKQDNTDNIHLAKPEWIVAVSKNCNPIENNSTSDEIIDADPRALKLQTLTKRQECLKFLTTKSESIASKVESLSYESVDSAAIKEKLIKNSEYLKKEQNKIKSNADTLDLTKEEKIKKAADGRLKTDEIWFAQLFLGQRFSPLYNEDGENQGFKQNKFYSEFSIDTRWEFGSNNTSTETSTSNTQGMSPFNEYSGKGRYAILFGTNIKFYSADIITCENYTDEVKKEECKKETGADETAVQPKADIENLNFNDVADTIDASINLSVPFYLNENRTVDFGPSFKIGVQSREKLKSNGSSLDSYQAVGLKSSYNDFFNDVSSKNGMPRFDIEYLHIWTKDYANLGKSRRHLIQGKYRLMEESPLYVGLIVNRGSGPDEVALSISWGLNLENLISRF